MKASLGSVCRFLNGGTPSKAVAEYFDGDIPWITSADITGPIAGHARSFITDEAVKNSAVNKVAAGTVLLVTRTGVGKVAIAAKELCFSQDITALIPDSKKLEAGYLVHFLRTKKEHFLGLARGATIQGITRNVVSDLSIPLPPLPEQRRIAAILDQADALRAKRREALAQLDILEDAVFLEFQQTTGTESREILLSGLSQNTRGSFVNGPFGSDLLTSELQDDGVPVVYIRDIRNGQYQRVSTSCVSDSKARDLAVCAVRPGDVLVAKVGDPPGIAAVYPEGEPVAVVTQDVIRLRPNLDVATPEFIKAYLNSPVGRWKIAGITVQATRARVSLGDFKKLTIEVPPLPLQVQFVKFIGGVKRLKRLQEAALAELDSLFSSLQHRAFRGEL